MIASVERDRDASFDREWYGEEEMCGNEENRDGGHYLRGLMGRANSSSSGSLVCETGATG